MHHMKQYLEPIEFLLRFSEKNTVVRLPVNSLRRVTRLPKIVRLNIGIYFLYKPSLKKIEKIKINKNGMVYGCTAPGNSLMNGLQDFP
jgi:hypothetical protein